MLRPPIISSGAGATSSEKTFGAGEGNQLVSAVFWPKFGLGLPTTSARPESEKAQF